MMSSLIERLLSNTSWTRLPPCEWFSVDWPVVVAMMRVVMPSTPCLKNGACSPISIP